MKIMIINPNSDLDMTEAIQKTATEFANGEYQIICKHTPEAPEFIETYEDQIKAAPGMIQLIKDNEDRFDGFIIACHCDPNLDTMKEITRKPVVGIGEASIKIASMLGHKFSIISTSKHSISNKEALVRKYYLQDALASVRAPEGDSRKLNDEEKYIKAAKIAIAEDMAEVIVLGCAGMTGIDKRLEKLFKIPVLDGVICALIIITGLIKYKVSTSKVRRYNPNLDINT